MDRARERRFDEPDSGYGPRGYRNDRGGFRGGRSPPRNPNYRGGRSPLRRSPSRRSPPPRRGRTPQPYDNGYGQAGRVDERPRSRSQRRRSRSPPPVRERDDGYGQRNRAYREERRRSPAPYVPEGRATYDAPPRDGSPPRVRERSPPPANNYRQYSPPPKHGRYANNVDEDFDRRDGPPPRDDGRRYPREGSFRARGRSRSPYRVSAHASHGDTPNSSRRSSPRSYGERMRIDKPSPGFGTSRYDQSSDKPSPRGPLRERSPPRRTYSPRPRSPVPRDVSPPGRSPRRGYSPARSPQDDSTWSRNRGPPPDRDVPPSRERNDYQDRGYSNRSRPAYPVGQTSRTWRKPSSPAPAYPTHEERSPPPADYPPEPYREPAREPSPTGTPAHPRQSVLHAPSQPRGGRGGGYPREPRESREPPYAAREEAPYRGRDEQPAYRGRDDGPYRGRGRGYGGPSRGGYDSRPSPGSRGASYHGSYQQPTSPPPFEGGPGSAGGGGGRGRGAPGGPSGNGWEHPPRGPPFRTNNSSSTTYPRTQHFNTQKNHLSTLAQPADGGRKAPSALEPSQEKRLAHLDEERKKLMDAIEEKERAKRQSLRDWDNVERESKRESFKAELAEGHLERMSGETSAGGAY